MYLNVFNKLLAAVISLYKYTTPVSSGEITAWRLRVNRIVMNDVSNQTPHTDYLPWQNCTDKGDHCVGDWSVTSPYTVRIFLTVGSVNMKN
jgi:hypothetical protein